jgi:chromosomal replication initiation ATPase DnaA
MWADLVLAPTIYGPDLSLELVNHLTGQPEIVALIDNAQGCDETALFTLLTAIEHRGGAVLLIDATPPTHWTIDLPDLKSRLAAIAYEAMTAPEPALLASIIVRHAAAAGFLIDDEASQYLATRIPRTFAAARDIVLCMQGIESAKSKSPKSPKSLAKRALHALYTHDGYEDPMTTPDLFDT